MVFFKTERNQIILYQQLSNLDKTVCVGWPGMRPLKNLYDPILFTNFSINFCSNFLRLSDWLKILSTQSECIK